MGGGLPNHPRREPEERLGVQIPAGVLHLCISLGGQHSLLAPGFSHLLEEVVAKFLHGYHSRVGFGRIRISCRGKSRQSGWTDLWSAAG